jgi:hypothetical protein
VSLHICLLSSKAFSRSLLELIPTSLSHQKSAEDEEFGELYLFKWTTLLIPPTTLIILNMVGVVAGISDAINNGYGSWGPLFGKLFFAFWVIVHLYPFLKGLMGRQNRTPTIVVLWSDTSMHQFSHCFGFELILSCLSKQVHSSNNVGWNARHAALIHLSLYMIPIIVYATSCLFQSFLSFQREFVVNSHFREILLAMYKRGAPGIFTYNYYKKHFYHDKTFFLSSILCCELHFVAIIHLCVIILQNHAHFLDTYILGCLLRHVW